MPTQLSGYEKAFETAFKTYFKPLHAYALSFLENNAQAEDIVQQVFLKIWEKQDKLDIISLKPYLYRSVHNACLNQLKQRENKITHSKFIKQVSVNSYEELPMLHEMEERIRKAIKNLPQQCRIIFQLSRFEDLKYREIADQLQLSVKTVETQMSKALQLLRVQLIDLLPLILMASINMFL